MLVDPSRPRGWLAPFSSCCTKPIKSTQINTDIHVRNQIGAPPTLSDGPWFSNSIGRVPPSIALRLSPPPTLDDRPLTRLYRRSPLAWAMDTASSSGYRTAHARIPSIYTAEYSQRDCPPSFLFIHPPTFSFVLFLFSFLIWAGLSAAAACWIRASPLIAARRPWRNRFSCRFRCLNLSGAMEATRWQQSLYAEWVRTFGGRLFPSRKDGAADAVSSWFRPSESGIWKRKKDGKETIGARSRDGISSAFPQTPNDPRWFHHNGDGGAGRIHLR